MTADGDRFLMVFPTEQDAGQRPEITVVVNWSGGTVKVLERALQQSIVRSGQ